MNNIWIYSISVVDPNYLVVGLNNGVIMAFKMNFNLVYTHYKNLFAVREGLTIVLVKNMTSGAECRIDMN